MDLPAKWIESGSAGRMDSTNFQFDKVGYHQENLLDLKAAYAIPTLTLVRIFSLGKKYH
jgi:hypothetical protein